MPMRGSHPELPGHDGKDGLPGHETLFVLVGDHGESFGEHGVIVHNSSLYEEE